MQCFVELKYVGDKYIVCVKCVFVNVNLIHKVKTSTSLHIVQAKVEELEATSAEKDALIAEYKATRKKSEGEFNL